MIYIGLSIALLLMMLGYLRWAERKGIVDRPNGRSSHSRPTIRGGGVIVPAAVLLWALFFDHDAWLFVSAVLLAGGIGFADDRYTLSQIPRFLVQSVAVLLVMGQAGYAAEPVWLILIGFILITGWLNAFNFMDGVNGISVLYALAVLGGAWLFSDRIPEVEASLMYVILIALVIFGWFNVRPRAVAFAGDAGSLSLGLILAWPVTLLVLESGRWEFILLLGVYGVDTVLTIVHRLIRRENIFEAHRSHLYQYLANEAGWGHLPVAILYAATQTAITLGLYSLNPDHWLLYSITVLISLAIIYILVKKVILDRVG